MNNEETKARLMALGFSEQASTEVVDFLGQRVYAGVKEAKIKKRDPFSKDPA